MQKPVLLLAAALLLGTSLGAQAQRRGRAKSSTYNTSLGLKAGVAISNFVGSDAEHFGTDYLTGFQGGIFANISLSQLVAFQPELLYSRKGFRNKATDFALKLDYVDVPLAFHINTDGLFFELGPQLGFLFNARQQQGNASIDATKSFNTVDFGYLGGLGFQFKEGLGVGVRYNGGFINAPAPLALGPLTIQYRQRNSSIQAYLTYSFNSH